MELDTLALNVICPEHGAFAVHADDHLDGIGCPVCEGDYLTVELDGNTNNVAPKTLDRIVSNNSK